MEEMKQARAAGKRGVVHTGAPAGRWVVEGEVMERRLERAERKGTRAKVRGALR